MNPPRFIIRYRVRKEIGEVDLKLPGTHYALHFHENLYGRKVFTLVADADASVFSDPAEATRTALAHGLHPDNAEVCNAPELQVQAA